MALSNIVIKDGTSPTPVDRTFEVFTPQVGSTPASLLQKAGGITKLNERMSLLVRRTAGTAYKVQVSLACPRVTDVALGTVETGHIDISVVLPDGFTPGNRADMAAYVKNVMAHATVQNAIASVVSFA